jgi:hypothetical protein
MSGFTAAPTAIGWPLSDKTSVLICLDLEAHCYNQTYAQHNAGITNTKRRICEVGIASFDPAQVPFANAGDRGKATWQFIKAKAFGITDNRHEFKNGSRKGHGPWCEVGQVTDFEFGEPAWRPLKAMKATVINHVRRVLGDNLPYSHEAAEQYHSGRRALFLFFGGGNDITWLREMGIDLRAEFPNSEIVDIQHGGFAARLARLWHVPQISAQRMFDALKFCPTHLHCGGNDAVWELRAMIAMMVLPPECVRDGKIPSDAPHLDKDGNDVSAAAIWEAWEAAPTTAPADGAGYASEDPY